MTAFIGFLGLLVALVVVVCVFGLLYKMWDSGFLQALAFVLAVIGGLCVMVVMIYDSALWMGDKIIAWGGF